MNRHKYSNEILDGYAGQEKRALKVGRKLLIIRRKIFHYLAKMYTPTGEGSEGFFGLRDQCLLPTLDQRNEGSGAVNMGASF
jgi:hypothetical protein